MQGNERELRLLGLAVKACKTIIGVPLICDALKRGASGKRPCLVLLASDASANSEKRMRDRTAFYGVPCRALRIDSEKLALTVGKREAAVAAVAVTDEGLAKAIVPLLADEG
jgi:ribosomal protein L7Ae-like RNA K-turn-binding protein